MKMFWFFNATSEIPWAFKMCGIFQMCCDSFLGVQYLMYGSGSGASSLKSQFSKSNGNTSNWEPARVSTPMGEKDGRLE